MKSEIDALYIEESCRDSDLVRRVTAKLPPEVAIYHVEDGRVTARAQAESADPFGGAKRRLVLMKRRAPFVMGCPAGSQEFACCGYLVMVLASNCPMDCSYCFLQEYIADNPAWQIYANYQDVFEELEKLGRGKPGRALRIGTGELADSLAFDSVTGINRELVEYFAGRENLLLELKTKTDEIEGLLSVDPKERSLVSWTLSPERVYRTSEHRTAPPSARIAAAARMLAHGYKVAFHLDPIIAYPEAEADYAELLEHLFDEVPPERIAFISIGGLRLTPTLRGIARKRFPRDPMLVGEQVLAPDGRYRAFTPLRMGLYAKLREQIARANPRLPIYLCMESASAHRRVFGLAPAAPASLGARLAGS